MKLDEARERPRRRTGDTSTPRWRVTRAGRAERRRVARAARSRTLLSDASSSSSGGRARQASRARRAERRVEALRRELDEAEQALEAARAGAQPPSFARRGSRCSATRATPAATSSPSAAAPRPCPSAHDHHDYPAADIAAPAGSPVYALADASSSARGATSTALRHRRDDPDARTGSTGRTATSPTSTRTSSPGRCSRRARSSASSARPGTAPGRTSTCSCSRPTPIRSRRAWFRGFAGTAFTWQGDGRALHGGAAGRPAPRVFGRSRRGAGRARARRRDRAVLPLTGVNPGPRPADGVQHAFPAACGPAEVPSRSSSCACSRAPP